MEIRYGWYVKKLAIAIGVVESAAIFVFGLSIAIWGTGAGDTSTSPPQVQFIFYSTFAALLALCTRGISKQRNWARTPFFLGQIFVVISGQLLFSGTLLASKVAGVILVSAGIVGFVALIRTPQD
jgi:hypothetical protein